MREGLRLLGSAQPRSQEAQRAVEPYPLSRIEA